MNEIDIQKKEMYMVNARNLCLGTNATYIPLTCVGVSRWGNTNFGVFRYQHVGIPNAKFRFGGLSHCKEPTQMFLRHSGI